MIKHHNQGKPMGAILIQSNTGVYVCSILRITWNLDCVKGWISGEVKMGGLSNLRVVLYQ